MKPMLWQVPLLLVVASTARAPAETPRAPAQQLEEAAAAFDSGRTDEAIRRLETLADSGFAHPDASYTRAVSYLRRGTSGAARSGDLGQAAAGFREALALRPGDLEAERGLEEAHLAVARQSSKASELDTDTLGLGVRLMLSIDAWVLAALALLGSMTAAVGLLLRRFGRNTTKTAGTIALGIGLATSLLCAALGTGADLVLGKTRTAIVVTERAPLLDEAGRALKGVAPLPEGTEVRAMDGSGHLLELSLPEGSAFVRRTQVRILAGR